ncbi:MAG: hypothetical protein KBC41_01195 [Candidatus Pacebacteria bacterium]|nr:hypothetical protein [Candidatus Paceibacterota bacterium]MBP9866678.1 hypothetical protein [Candidatus Paceibacterota bacterium]
METEHKKIHEAFLVLFFIIFLVGISLFLPAKWFGVKTKSYTPLDLQKISKPKNLNEDSDNNGIPDWRDLALSTLSTSTKNTLASQKVDPLIKQRLEDPKNITASFSKNMYINSSYVQKNGNITEEEKKKIIAETMKQEISKIVIQEYKVNDLIITSSDSIESKKKYGNALGSLIKKATVYEIGGGDVEILKVYIEKKDTSLLQNFTDKKENLEGLIKTMLTIPVPYSAIPYHLLALNRISEYKTILEGFETTDSDPVRSTIAFNMYYPNIKGLFFALNNMRDYFNIENVIFKESEAGYVFTSGYTIQ